MLGPFCFQFSGCGRLHISNVVLVPTYFSIPPFLVIRSIFSKPVHAKLCQSSTRSCLLQSDDMHSSAPQTEGCMPNTLVRRVQCRSRSFGFLCKAVIGTNSLHTLFPGFHLSIFDRDRTPFPRESSVFSDSTVSKSSPYRSTLKKIVDKKGGMALANLVAGYPFSPGSLSIFGNCKLPVRLLHEGTKAMSHRLSIAADLRDRSWNAAAFGVRPSCQSYGRHSAWLLFGVCACLSAAAGSVEPDISASPAYAEPVVNTPEEEVVPARASHGKQIHTNYSVTGIPGDGRCLFRAVTHGAQLRRGKAAPNESLQREYADDLRQKVVDELIKRRKETEWFIEGDFDTYTMRMRQPHVWGGEPELLMASHVLKMPITVFMLDVRSRGLISIAEYGQEYGKENPAPVRVLYHGFGHYDALQFPDNGAS